MRLLKILSVLLLVGAVTIAGCESGGGGNPGGSPSGASALSSVTASLQTSVGSQAVCKLIVNNVPSNICGLDATLLIPAGATFNSVVSSGVANGSLISANPVGNTLKLALASGTGFSSGEVATVTYNISGSVKASDFSVSAFSPHSCP